MQQQQITRIQLVLENHEVVNIEGKYIGVLNIEDISYSINRIACNSINEMYTCKHFSISAYRDGANINREDMVFGLKNDSKYNRVLQYADITSICIYFDNGEEKHIYVKWKGDSSYINKAQKSYINKFGDLFIVVDAEMGLEECFDLEEVEDEGSISLTWSLYGASERDVELNAEEKILNLE